MNSSFQTFSHGAEHRGNVLGWRPGDEVRIWFDFLGNTSLLWSEETKTTIRQRRIENMASSMKVTGPTTSSARTVQRPEMNMDIDTLRLVSVVWIGWYAVVAPDMVCNSMQWYAMVCNGMQWYEMVCNGMQWHAMACNGMVWNGMEWNDMVSVDWS